MKKFLFTLASLVAFSFGYAAEPVLAYSESEITLGGGENQEIVINVMESGGVMVTGLQLNFNLVNPAGELLDNGCHLTLKEEYGTRDAWNWFGLVMVGANGTVYNNGTALTSTNGTYHQTDTWDDEGDYMPENDYGVENVHPTYTGKYNLILANIGANLIWNTRYSFPLQLVKFTVAVDEGWQDEYAELQMVLAEFSRTDGLASCELINLKINNADYQVTPPEPVALTGEIIIGEVDENGMLTVAYNGEEEGVTITVTVNGEPVEVVDGMIQLPEYGTYTIVVTAAGEGYEPMTETFENVEWAEPTPPEPVQTPAPEIVVTPGDDAYIFEAVGEGTVTLFLITNNGLEEVENPYTVVRTEQDQVVKFSAVAHVDGQTDGTVTSEYLVPALEVQEKTADPTYEIVDDPEAQTVTVVATGDGHITILWDEQVVAEGDGTAEWVIPYGDDPEGEEYGFTVYAQEDGKEKSDPVNGEVVVPGKPVTPPEPVQTPTPEITYEVTETSVIITATGEGEVLLYVDGEPVENPVTIERGATDVVVTVTATAQGEDMLISEEATMEITIPAVGAEPEDPHMTGYWLLMYDKDGNEVWYDLQNTNPADPDAYQTNVALHYSQFGGRPLKDDETDDINPKTPFCFYIDGVRYACGEDLTEPVYGNANENPLSEQEENLWNIPVGYYYVIGVLEDTENGGYYMQISKGLYTGIDEMNADKTIANVRYFNMAGQEMHQADGVCIIVTTYTDGTTSAVKVMK